MTPDRLRECLTLIGWTGQGLSRQVGLDERQIRRWLAGESPIPSDIAAWLEIIAACHVAHPAPKRRRIPPRSDTDV